MRRALDKAPWSEGVESLGSASSPNFQLRPEIHRVRRGAFDSTE
jgi:hypothetical protein